MNRSRCSIEKKHSIRLHMAIVIGLHMSFTTGERVIDGGLRLERSQRCKQARR